MLSSCHLEIWTGSEDTGHHPTGQVCVFEALRYRASMSRSALPTSRGPGVMVICLVQSQGPAGCFGLSSLEIHARCKNAAELKAWLYLLALHTHVSTGLNPSPAKPQPPEMLCLNKGHPGAQKSHSSGDQEASCCLYSPRGGTVTWVPRQCSTPVLPGRGFPP